jgi:NADH-quinone oxidoreductase subunit L
MPMPVMAWPMACRCWCLLLLSTIGQLWLNAWGFDWLYDRLFVKPYVWLAHLHRNDPVDQAILVIPFLARTGHDALSRVQNGRLRWYVASIGLGAVLVVALLLLG